MLRLLFRIVLILLLAGPIVLAALVLSPQPRLPEGATLSPAQAAQARSVVRRIRDATGTGAEIATIRLSAADLDALLATGGRPFRPMRGRVAIDDTAAHLAVSARLPAPPRVADLGLPLWINLDARVAPSDQGFALTDLRLGRVNIPPGLAVGAARRGLDLASGADLGTLLLASVLSLETTPGVAVLTIDTGGPEESFFSRVAGGVRGALGLGDTEAVARHYATLSQAAASGALPLGGSVTPWLRQTLEGVAATDHESPRAARADLRAALLALAAHCGDAAAIGQIAGDIGADGLSACSGTTLGGRADLRKHFTLSAALQVASGSAASFGLGEVKELVDAGRRRGSGFSFDDIAADLAGIRFAETAFDALPDGLPALAARLETEAAYLPRVDDLPSLMTEGEFAARFGAVDSPAYDAQLDEIEARIDALPAFGA